MKFSTLVLTASVLAFSGAVRAEVSFSGEQSTSEASGSGAYSTTDGLSLSDSAPSLPGAPEIRALALPGADAVPTLDDLRVPSLPGVDGLPSVSELPVDLPGVPDVLLPTLDAPDVGGLLDLAAPDLGGLPGADTLPVLALPNMGGAAGLSSVPDLAVPELPILGDVLGN